MYAGSSCSRYTLLLSRSSFRPLTRASLQSVLLIGDMFNDEAHDDVYFRVTKPSESQCIPIRKQLFDDVNDEVCIGRNSVIVSLPSKGESSERFTSLIASVLSFVIAYLLGPPTLPRRGCFGYF